MSNPNVTAPASVQSSAVERPACLVELQGITKAFGPTLANADIDFAVANSDVIGLVGGNGAGKSTLMRNLVRDHSADVRTYSNSTAPKNRSLPITPRLRKRVASAWCIKNCPYAQR